MTYFLQNKLVPGDTQLSVSLPIEEWLRVQTIVIAHELYLERSKRKDRVKLRSHIQKIRKNLVAAINSARGLTIDQITAGDCEL